MFLLDTIVPLALARVEDLQTESELTGEAHKKRGNAGISSDPDLLVGSPDLLHLHRHAPKSLCSYAASPSPSS